ncbi:MAG: CRISPR-associated DxTHG motif protein [Deltaproteobacteria bacterium]|nr:CRISPR-associated DxTHG motif protein [Deltaproteobacteria bacterium]
MKRLVSFLGLGPERAPEPFYTETRYQWEGGAPSRKTPLLEAALCELVGDVGALLVLGTREVYGRWIAGAGESPGEGWRPSHPASLFQKYVGRECWFHLVPHGIDEAQRRSIFDTTLSALAPQRLDAAGETEVPTEIVLDITHGFRSQPILGTAAVAFSLAEQTRTGRPIPIRVVYGAFEMRDRETEVAPVWDLTDFVTLSRWNAAIDALTRYGRADDLEDLGRETARRQVARATTPDERATLGVPGRFGALARALADDLALNRWRDLFTKSAPAMKKFLDSEDANGLLRGLPQLRGAVSELRGWVAPLCAEEVLGPSGLRASAALAERYEQLQRFAELAAVLREGLVTHHGLLTGRRGPDPGPGCKVARDGIERAWNEEGQRPPESQREVVRENLNLARGIVDPRNDIEHGGINEQPVASGRLRTTLEDKAKAYRALIQDFAPAAPRSLLSVFVNLSNHPISTWSEEQLRAARDLGCGEPVELEGGMPEVKPQDKTEKVRRQAEDLADRAKAQGAVGAHVAGEPTLSFALVQALRDRGLRCFAATTDRDAEVTARGGETEKRSTFRFKRWREYP